MHARAFGLCAFALAASACSLAAHSRRAVAVAHANGMPSCTLQESANGEELWVSLATGGRTVIASCVSDDVEEVASPGSRHRVIVRYRNCGASVDFATRVLVSRRYAERLVAVFQGRQAVGIEWRAETEVEIRHPELTAEEVFLTRDETQGIVVTLVPTGVSAERSPNLDLANRNFGAAGRAAGLPPELLRRVAGWAQEASGLHRAEWGSWSGPPPYGDDPTGRQQVEAGIRYFESGAWDR